MLINCGLYYTNSCLDFSQQWCKTSARDVIQNLIGGVGLFLGSQQVIAVFLLPWPLL